MKTNNRLSRINDEIMKELSQIIRAELKDPRIGVMTSVIRVETTQDLKYCKVYVSVLGDEKDKENVMKGLQNAGGFIRRLIAQRITCVIPLSCALSWTNPQNMPSTWMNCSAKLIRNARKEMQNEKSKQLF